jgi:pimeloyl-ACP methyl ester carboxylesterase
VEALSGNDAHAQASVDYPGFGLSTGKPSKTGCRRAADAALAFFHNEYAIGSSNVTVIGWSLGSALAVDLAVRWRLDGLVLLSPMTSIVGELLDELGIRSRGLNSAASIRRENLPGGLRRADHQLCGGVPRPLGTAS